MENIATSTDILANEWMKNNPYVLTERFGHVYKTDLYTQVGITAARFRYQTRLLCDADSEFETKYQNYRKKRSMPISLAEYILKKIIDNPNCTVTFVRSVI